MELREVGPDIFLLNVKVPINVDNVNLYVFRGAVPTLLDTGTNTSEVYEETQKALRYLGIKQLEQVVATHWHVDHAGGAKNLAQEGTRILIGSRDYEEWASIVKGRTFELFQQWAEFEWGVPQEQISSMVHIYNHLSKLTTLPDKVERIEDQQIIRAGDTSLRAILTPGHTAGHLSFLEEKNGFLFSGDMLLPDQIPYPGIWLEDGEAVSGLPSYMNSLNVVEEWAPREYFPAHGAPQGNPLERCEEVRNQILHQIDRFTPQASVFEGALQLSKGKFNPGVMFIQLHYVYGWEKLKDELATQLLLTANQMR